MNDFAPGDFRSTGDSPDRQYDAVRTALVEMGELAHVKVPSGVFLSWGEAVGWPDWLYEGTSLRPSSPIPTKITVAEDFTIMAHFLDRYGPKALLASMLTDTLAFASLRSMENYAAAPNILAFLHYFTKAANIQLANYKVAIVDVRGGVELKIASLTEIGKLSAFGEHVGALMVVRILALFQPLLARIELGTGWSPKLSLRAASAEVVKTVSDLGMIEVSSSDEETSIFVPDRLNQTVNPRHDPDLWNSLYAQLKTGWFEDSSPFSILSLRSHIRQSLRKSRKALNIEELANDLAISNRTLHRKLASLGISFRELVCEERMNLAEQLLKDRTYSVAEVGHALGYGNAATFSRAFRSHFGNSPTEWRAKNSQLLARLVHP